MVISKKKIAVIFSIILIAVGALGVIPSLYYQYKLNRAISTMQPVVPSTTVITVPNAIEDTPTKLIIPSLNISLPVIDGYYDPQTRQWTLTQNKVQFAAMTQKPNNITGNTFIYGHNSKALLLTMPQIPAGAEAIIETQKGYTFHYVYKSNRVVDPTDTSVFQYKGAPILTIQTCAGAWYQNRQLFTFDFQKVDQPAQSTAAASSVIAKQ